MEDYLRRVRSRLGAGGSEGPKIHAVLGGPEADVDTVASTLSLALHLSQKEPSGDVCVPVLCVRRCDAVLPGETVTYLQRVKICESLLLWREDVDLLKLHHTGKLSLTLLRDGLVASSEYHTLESSVMRVVHRHGQQDAGEEGASSVVMTVAREILQEEAEHIGAALGEILGEALRLQSETLWVKHGRRSVQLEELMSSLGQWSDVTLSQHHQAKQQDNLLTKELKEFSDGELTIALTTVTRDVEDLHSYVGEFKSLSHRHGYEGLVVVFSISDTVHHPCQQVAVYSNNTDILNQICCEVEESSSWSLSGELEARECSQGCLQVYHLPINTASSSGTPPRLEEEIQGLLKEFVDRRSSVLACHPSSRTSSTEGVAGSIEFSQGSSGINDMYGSDIERTEGGGGDVVATARVTADGEEDSVGAGVGAGGELVSPDSGMVTIRSSRSSKESSVFLSDDSPIGEVIAGGGAAAGLGGLFLRNPSPLGFSSLSPPIPPERRRHRSSRNRSDNFDLFSFDPLHSNHSLPAGGALAHTGGRGDEGGRSAGSSSLSEFEELSLVDFSAPNLLVGHEGGPSSDDHQQCCGVIHGNEMIDTVVPPTPVNSLVGSCPPSSCGVRFFPEDVAERITSLQHKESVSSSLSEAWDEIGFDMRGGFSSDDANAWNLTEDGGSESLQNILEGGRGKGPNVEVREEEVLKSKRDHQRDMSLKPQLSLITEHIESYDNWNPDSGLREPWNSVTLADLQLTPPEEEVNGKCMPSITGVKEKMSSLSRKKELLSTLTPDTSKEEDDGVHGGKGDQQMALLDFWTYSAQRGFLKSDSGTIPSYPESLDMWNMTIQDDGLSPLTTPDNLSEHSDSFCGQIPKVGVGASLESPLGFSDGGMEMWNTTIQEDSSSTITTPEGPETGRDLGHMGSWDASTEAPESHAGKQVEEKEVEEEGCTNKALSQTPEEVGWRGGDNKYSVKIVIEGEEDTLWTEKTGNDDTKNFQVQQSVKQNMTSENPQEQTSLYQGLESWAMPVSNMVTSTSEYDNVGAGVWSLPSSPETYASPVVDMTELEGQSSPFIAVVKLMETVEGHDQYQKPDCQIKSKDKAVIAGNEQPAGHVFLFDGTGEFGHLTRSGGSSTESEYDNKCGEGSEETLPDRTEQASGHSPFILVSCSSHSQPPSANHYLSPGEAAVTQTQTDQSLSPSLVKWDNLLTTSKKYDGLESACNNASSPLDWTTKIVNMEDGPATESLWDPHIEANGNVGSTIMDTMSLSSSFGGERDILKYSPDSLHPSSRDDLRSNSDGDSPSGLEMEHIIVSGTVKETKRERKDMFRPREGDSGRQAGGPEKSMETYSMLSYAATRLQIQAQALHRQHQRSTEQSRQNQMVRDIDSADAQENQALFFQTTLDSPSQSNTGMRHSSQSTELPSSDQSTVDVCNSSQGSMHCQTSVHNARQAHIVPELISPNQSKANAEAFHQSDSTGHSQSQVEESNYDDQTSIMLRSASASLRYQSDHFLKTREEVYVRSQISMEDSDEGGQSPSALPSCPPSLGGLQVWGDQLMGQDIPQATSEPQSPILTNSSLSHNSSLIGTPVSESCHSTERGVGLPFSGDLMEEEDEEEEQEEKIGLECPALLNWTTGVDREKEEIDYIHRPHSGPTDLLTVTEDLIGGCSSQRNDLQALEPNRDRFPQNTVDYYDEQPVKAGLGRAEWSAEQQTGRHEVSQESQSSSLGCQDVTSQHTSAQPTSENALYQWTGSQNLTEGQTQYGYNYHHTDQRTENQRDHQGYIDSKGDSQQNTTDVYAEFRAETTTTRYGSEQVGNDNETGVVAEYNLDDPGRYRTNVQCNAEDTNYSNTKDASELHRSQYKPEVHSQNQFDGQSFYQSDTHHESEDHAQYVPEGYVHFLLSRPSQQGDHATWMTMASNKEGADEMDYREDPPSSLDLSGGSNQRRKLAALPMNVSLDHSEGSLLSGDTPDTGDEALDTGDDLDINIDELDTPDGAESLELNRHAGDSEASNQGAGAGTNDAIPEYAAAEEHRDSSLQRSVVIGEQEHRIDMKCIEPYQRVISHGGYYGEQNAIIVFAACFLPDSDCDNYHYVMENLFLYVISTLELMVAEDYMIVYLNGATPRRRMPGFSWMKKCYQMIDRRLKKNLKLFIIVHPSWFIRTVLGITRPFISSKFSSKIKYVNSLVELRGMIPMEYVHIPPSVVKLDTEIQETTAKADKKGNSTVGQM